MGLGFAPSWLRQVSPLLHKTTLTTGNFRAGMMVPKVFCRSTCSLFFRK